MLYCEACGCVYEEGEKCPLCRKDRGRAPRPEDACFLVEKGQIESDMLEDVLKQNGIQCLKKSTSGAGMAMFTGLLLESFRLYVAYRDLDQAREIAESLLSKEGEFILEDTEDDPEGEMEDELDDDSQ